MLSQCPVIARLYWHSTEYCILHNINDVMEPTKIHISPMRISCAKSAGGGFRFVAGPKLPAIIATAIQLSYLQLNS